MILKEPLQEAIKYCFKNNYRIYPTTTDNVTFKITMERGVKKATIKQIYTKRTIDKAVEKLYLRIHNESTKK